ncbi:choice-of-anchor I family protein [Paenibacillus lentus]|uniref:choice-of-anchor I family protein n=1 Tax=Paenibacillus lentus TaxID=1338368 RepID=UPI00364F757F
MRNKSSRALFLLLAVQLAAGSLWTGTTAFAKANSVPLDITEQILPQTYVTGAVGEGTPVDEMLAPQLPADKLLRNELSTDELGTVDLQEDGLQTDEIQDTYDHADETFAVTQSVYAAAFASTFVDKLYIRKIGSYRVGAANKDGGVAEIVKYNKRNGKFYLVNGSSNPPSIDIVKLDANEVLMKEKTIQVKELAETEGFVYGDLTSVDVHAETRRVAVSVQEADAAKSGKILILDEDGSLLTSYQAGVQPDMVLFTPDGRYILTADEGEPRVSGIDPEGSVTIVDTLTEDVVHVKFNDPSVIDDLVHIRGASGADGSITGRGSKTDTVFDLEPEYIALSADGATAYVSLQENNAIAEVDIGSKTATSVRGLGAKDFNDPPNALDLLKDGTIKLENVPFYGLYLPDGIAAYDFGGQTYLFTANEGDVTEWPGRENGTTLGKLRTRLSPDSPAAQFLADKGTAYDKVEVAGDLGSDDVYLYGGRSFAVWNASDMKLVYDSGSDFEQITAQRLPDYFNTSNSKTEPDDRSSKKGPEPEYVTLGQVGDKVFAFVGLERIGGVMTYDVTNPAAPEFVNYTNTRDFGAGLETDTGPEGLEFISAPDSPTGRPLLLVANEVGGTVAVLELEVSKVTLNKTELQLSLGGDGEKLVATVDAVGVGQPGVRWSSSDPSVASVNAVGLVTPVSAGIAQITAVSEDGYGMALAKITVSEASTADWKLTVMHTNDTHAHLADIARRGTLVREIREETAGNSLLVDAGDVFSGDLYFTKWLGLADLAFMNRLNYDAMTFGNHEFDRGTAVLADFVGQAQFPLVSSNIDFSKDRSMSPWIRAPKTIDAGALKTTGDAGVYPYVVLDVNGKRVGIMGLTTEDTKETSSPGKDVVFRQATEAAAETVKAMEQEGINIIIVLSHLGYSRDKQLASVVEGIDLIVGGHTHTKLERPEIVVNSSGSEPTVIVQANEWGKYLGRVDLYFDRNGVVLTGSGQTSGQLIAVDSEVEENSVLLAMLKPFNAALDVLKKQVIGIADAALDGERNHVRSRETNLGNLIADGMLAKGKSLKNADVALTNGGGIRASIDEGEITMGELRTVMPFGNTLVMLDVTGKQLKDGLENGISGAKLADLPGKFPQVAGMKFKWDPHGSVGNKVYDVQIKSGDRYIALNESATYRLATNSFVANGGDGYVSFAEAIASGAYYEDLGYPDYEIFMDYVEQLGGKVSPKVEGRIVEQAKPGGNPGDGNGSVGGGTGNGGSSSSPDDGGSHSDSPDLKQENGVGANDASASHGTGAYMLAGEKLQMTEATAADGTEMIRITARLSDVEAALAAAEKGQREVIIQTGTPIAAGSGSSLRPIIVSLPAKVLASASGRDKNLILVIRTASASYHLPLHVLGLQPLASGSHPPDLDAAWVNVTLAPISGKRLEQINDEAVALGARLVPQTAIDFKVTLSVNDSEREIGYFGLTYISRMIRIPARDADKPLTAVQYVEAAQELQFVPAVKKVTEEGAALEIKRPGNSIYAVLEYSKTFTDIQGHWAEQQIEALASRMIAKGIDESSFAPGQVMSKAEFTALLIRSLGLLPAMTPGNDPFADVGPNTPFAAEIAAAAQYGIVSGDESGRFAPEKELTRAEMAVMAAHAIRLVKGNEKHTAVDSAAQANSANAAGGVHSLLKFKDRDTLPAWAATNVELLADYGIIQGNNLGEFDYGGKVTRAQAAVILLKMLQLLRFID